MSALILKISTFQGISYKSKILIRDWAPGLSHLLSHLNLKATDNSGIKASITCTRESGSQFQIGQTEIVCEALDPSGNTANCIFMIDVIG